MTSTETSTRIQPLQPDPGHVRDPRLATVEKAILQAVAYSDIFDYPLTADEIHRYAIGASVEEAVVHDLLRDSRLVPRRLAHRDGYYALPGRETIIETRRQREQAALAVWPRALRYGRIIASLPFVRMVAITGELAMNNIAAHSDIDYFIVTEPTRLWVCRLLTIAVVRSTAPLGDTVCPNYLLSDTTLLMNDRNLYTAHEIAQMVPIAGLATYRRLRTLNPWVAEYLPNADGPPRHVSVVPRGRLLRSMSETALRTRAGRRLEEWEMSRKVRKFTRENGRHPEAAFSRDWCKGHFDGHGERVLSAFEERWRAVETAES